MKVSRNLSWTVAPSLCAVVVILLGALMSPAAMAQEEKAVGNFPGVVQRDITLWSDGTRLSGVLLYPRVFLDTQLEDRDSRLVHDGQNVDRILRLNTEA